MKKWKTLSSELVFNNKWFRIAKDKVRLPNGKIIDDYFSWKAKEVVWIVPVTTDKKLLLVKQYKHGVGEITIEYPGAIKEDSETPKECAIRELFEETGYTAGKVVYIGEYFESPTKSSCRGHLFVAIDCVKTGNQYLDETEDIEVLKANLNSVLEMIKNKEMKFTGSIAGTFLATKYLK
jgi:ADP-ribose pyrophosphatase